MRRAGAVIVSGAVFLALLCTASILLLPNPAGAQVNGEPAIIEDTAPTNGTPDRVEIAFPEDQTCTVDAGATVTVRDPDGTQVELVDDDNVQITVTSTEITIVGTGTNDDIVADPVEGQAGTVPGFDTGEGTVESSQSIECVDEATNPATPAAPGPADDTARTADDLEDLSCDELLALFRGESSSEAQYGAGSGSEAQYGDAAIFADADVRTQIEVCLEREIVAGTGIDEDLPDTGGVSLLALAVLGMISTAAGLSVIRGGRR